MSLNDQGWLNGPMDGSLTQGPTEPPLTFRLTLTGDSSIVYFQKGCDVKRKWSVFGQDVVVEMTKGPKHDHQGNLMRGYYDPEKHYIWIDSTLNLKERHLTLIHELGHVLLFRLGLEQAVSSEMHELIVEAYSKFIYENFKFKS